MTKGSSFLIILLLVAALLPVYYVNRFLLCRLRPRSSMLRLLSYIFLMFGLVFCGILLVALLIKNLFPLP